MSGAGTRGYYIHEVTQMVDEAWEEDNKDLHQIVNALEEWLFITLKEIESTDPNHGNFFTAQEKDLREDQFVGIQLTIQPMQVENSISFSIDDQEHRRRNQQKELLETVLNQEVSNEVILQFAEKLEL